LYREWNPSGIVVFEAQYEHGLRHGKFSKFYDDGKPKLIQNFVKDTPHGEKKSYDKDGKMTKAVFDMGKKKS